MIFDISQPHTFLRAFAIVLLLSSNFMTISWTGYNPICLDPRHHLFLIPIAALAAIHFFNSKHSNKKIKLIVLIAGTAIIASYIDIFLILTHLMHLWIVFIRNMLNIVDLFKHLGQLLLLIFQLIIDDLLLMIFVNFNYCQNLAINSDLIILFII